MLMALAGTLGAAAVQTQGPTSMLEQSQGGAQRDDVAVLAQAQQPSATQDEHRCILPLRFSPGNLAPLK
jgi:hypothetical protein